MPITESTTRADTSRDLLVRGAKLIDGSGGTPIKDPWVLISGNRFSKVGPAESFDVSPEIQIVDCPNCTLIPGLMDMHLHIALYNCMSFQNHRVAQAEITPSLLQMYSLFHAQSCLDMGFTLLRDCGMLTPRGLYVEELCAVRDAINAGILQGPRLLIAGFTAITCSHIDLIRPPGMARINMDVADGPWELRKLARLNIRNGCDFIKTCASGGVSGQEDEGVRNITMDELNGLTDEAHAFRKQMAVHCLTTEAQKMAVAAGVDTIEHMVYHDDEAVDLIAEAGIAVTPTLLHRTDESIDIRRRHGSRESALRMQKRIQPHCMETFQKMYAGGVKIIMGTDMCYEPEMGTNAKELEIYVDLGMSPMEALMSATSVAANAVNLEHEVGTVEDGKLADLVAVDGDPLKDIKCLQQRDRIALVIKDGVICTDRRPGHQKSVVDAVPGSWEMIDA